MRKRILLLSAILSSQVVAEVKYSDLLLDPDNVELNEQFIGQRIRAGDLPPALSAVERVIQLQPLNLGARLLRARLLISLGNFGTAKTELEALDLIALPAAQASEVDGLLAEIDNELSSWSTRGSVALTVQRDDNIGAIPETATGTIDSENYDYKRADINLTAAAVVTSSYDLGNQSKDSIYYSLAGSRVSGDDSKLKDNTSGSVTIGTRLNRGLSRFNLYFQASKLDRDPVVRRLDPTNTKIKRDSIHTRTIGSVWSKSYQATNAQIGYSHARSDYMGRAVSNNSDSKTHSLTGSLFHTSSDTSAVFGGVGFERRRASDRIVPSARASQDRTVMTVNGGYVYIPKPFHRLTLSGKLRDLDYKERLSSDDKIRQDREMTISAAYVVSGDVISTQYSGWELGFSLSRVRNESNMASYDITNNFLGASLTYTF